SARDNSRTPMQWTDETNGGFTTGTPWMKVNPNYREINVKVQAEQKDSILSFYKKMIHLKKENVVFTYGKYDLLMEDDAQVYAYTRTSEDDKVIVIANLTGREAHFISEGMALDPKNILLHNYTVEQQDAVSEIHLKPYEARVYRL
ncbi:MAG: alpha-glucosidase C-terminal domain-containing protein, partial [Bacillota bacterium]|nr:alpha-glucosidase C-terminal domain-containing protein [Bacillota bacterium]